MVIITNNVPREVLDEEPDSQGCIEGYVMYRGEKYPLADFESVHALSDFSEFRKGKWDGYLSDSYFSGVLLKYVPGTNLEQVIMGRYYS